MMIASQSNRYSNPVDAAYTSLQTGSHSLPGSFALEDIGGKPGFAADLRRMIAHDGPRDLNALAFATGETARQCDILPMDPDEKAGPLEAAIRDFTEGDGRRLTELGLVLAVNGDHFVSLHLRRGKGDAIFYSYYDPSPSASARDTLKERIAVRLRRAGIDLERYFTGVRQGRDNSDVNNSGIYAVLAMRAMMQGQPEFDATTEDVLAWRGKLIADSETSSGQPDDDGAFGQALQGRSTACNKVAKQLLGSQAIKHVFDYFSAREAALFQALNKRLYHTVMPQVVQQIPFSDYPVRQSVCMLDIFCGGAAEAMGCEIPKALRRRFFGWLLYFGVPPGLHVSPKRMQAFLQTKFKDFDYFRQRQNAPGHAHIMQLCDWLGETLCEHHASLHESRRRGQPDQRHESGSDRPGEAQAGARKRQSIFEMFREDALPDCLMRKIEEKLAQVVAKGILVPQKATFILNNLKTTWEHLSRGHVSLDIVVLPKTKAGKNEMRVHLTTTPGCIDGTVSPNPVYEFRELVHDEKHGTLLSEKLKKDVQQLFHKLGWADRLGPSLRNDTPPIMLPQAGSSKLISMAALQIAGFHRLSVDPMRPLAERREASLAMEAECRDLARLFKKCLPDIDADAFAQELLTLCPHITELTLSRVAVALLAAVKQIMAARSVSPQELLTYLSLLKKCREHMVTWVKTGRIVNLHHAEVYKAINDLNAGVGAVETRLAMHGV